jgi:6-phosphogluconolactonase
LNFINEDAYLKIIVMINTDKISLDVVESAMFAGAVADEIIASARDVLANGETFSIALCGGRSPGATYRSLTTTQRASTLDWNQVKVFIGDERWVPPNDIASNMRMVKETLLQHVAIPEKNVFPMDTTLANPEECAKNYTEILKRELPEVDGTPQLDLLLLGLGEDGHIASLFPKSGAIEDRENLVVATYNPVDSTDRVSVAPRIILNAKRILFIVKGESKSDILLKFLASRSTSIEIPAMLTHAVKDRLLVYVDSAAAQKLPRELRGF